MTVDALLARLAALNVLLTVEGGRLLFDAPAGALSLELRAALAAHRAELLRRLTPPDATTGAVPIALADDANRFASWILRPDATGKPGWEAPDVPEASRWWARTTFDAPPAGPIDNIPRPARRLSFPWAAAIGRQRMPRTETKQKHAYPARTND